MKKLFIDFIKAITLVGGFFSAILIMKGEMWAFAVLFPCFFVSTAVYSYENDKGGGPDSGSNGN